MACEFGHVNVMRLFISHNVNINSPDSTGATSLHLAATSGNFEAVRFLLNQPGININAVDKRSLNARTIAQLLSHKNVVEMLDDYKKGDFGKYKY